MSDADVKRGLTVMEPVLKNMDSQDASQAKRTGQRHAREGRGNEFFLSLFLRRRHPRAPFTERTTSMGERLLRLSGPQLQYSARKEPQRTDLVSHPHRIRRFALAPRPSCQVSLRPTTDDADVTATRRPLGLQKKARDMDCSCSCSSLALTHRLGLSQAQTLEPLSSPLCDTR